MTPTRFPADAEVVVSTAIREDNPELARARERDQRVIHRGELLAELCAERRLLAVAGTHGKTTTAAMCIWALRATGADPAFFLGGELPGAGPDGAATNAGWGEGDWVVAEADESDASFLKLQPEVAVITNLELDHHSRWSSLAELTEAFAAFSSPASGVVTGADVRLPGQEAQRVMRFALEPAAGERAPDAGAARDRDRDRAGGWHPLPRPGRRRSTWRSACGCPAATTSPTRSRPSAASRWRAPTWRAAPRRSPASRASRAGWSSRARATALGSMTTTPTIRRRSRPPSRPLESSDRAA